MRAAASFPRWRPLWALFLRKMSENTSPQPTQQKHLDFKKTLGNWWYILNQTIVPVKALKKSGYQKTLSGNNAGAAVHPSYVKHPLFSWPTQHWGFRLQVQVLFWGNFFSSNLCSGGKSEMQRWASSTIGTLPTNQLDANAQQVVILLSMQPRADQMGWL